MIKQTMNLNSKQLMKIIANTNYKINTIQTAIRSLEKEMDALLISKRNNENELIKLNSTNRYSEFNSDYNFDYEKPNEIHSRP